MRRALAAAIVVAFAAATANAGVPAVPIPQDPNPGGASFVGAPASAQPLESFPVPRHPFMAPNGRSNIHDDAYQTDAAAGPGPLGNSIAVASTFHVAECASLTFDSRGRIVTICVGFEGPRLVMLDATTLQILAAFALPPRFPAPGTGTSLFNDFSGGGYFYLDHLDRAVIPANDRSIWVVAQQETAAGPVFALDRVYDVRLALQPGEAIVSVLPDWNGRLWFAGTGNAAVGTPVGAAAGFGATVGAVDPATGTVRATRLAGEKIANSFAVDETGGVYIVSDHALYRFDAAPDGAPSQTWREPYDRGTRVKPGQVNQGSGTTPTLIGGDYLTITDNADPQMNVIVYRRGAAVAGTREVCRRGVFAAGAGATDNSLIAVGSSIVVENNYGYSGPAATQSGATTSPGLARIDFDAGSGTCTQVWESPERAPSVVAKASLSTGLVYTYTKPADPENDDLWYFTAIDFRTGATVYKRLAGEGLGFNNNYAPVSLGPDGAAYVGALGGLVRLADTS